MRQRDCLLRVGDFLFGDTRYWKTKWDDVMDELLRRHVVNKFIRDMEDVLLDMYMLLDD
jgi:hypothetical protein